MYMAILQSTLFCFLSTPLWWLLHPFIDSTVFMTIFTASVSPFSYHVLCLLFIYSSKFLCIPHNSNTFYRLDAVELKYCETRFSKKITEDFQKNSYYNKMFKFNQMKQYAYESFQKTNNVRDPNFGLKMSGNVIYTKIYVLFRFVYPILLLCIIRSNAVNLKDSTFNLKKYST